MGWTDMNTAHFGHAYILRAGWSDRTPPCITRSTYCSGNQVYLLCSY